MQGIVQICSFTFCKLAAWFAECSIKVGEAAAGGYHTGGEGGASGRGHEAGGSAQCCYDFSTILLYLLCLLLPIKSQANLHISAFQPLTSCDLWGLIYFQLIRNWILYQY